MEMVQTLRAKAQEEGNLKTTKEQKVVFEKEIIIESANPEVIYVPSYSCTYVYGPWWYPHYPPYVWYPPPPQAFAQETSSFKGQGFSSPQEAVTAIVAATRALDPAKALVILGSDAEEIIFSGDKVAGQGVAVDFVEKYDEKNQLEMVSPTSATLVIGKADWQFPIPVVKSGEKWFFDVAAAKEEILNRRIGRN